MMPIHPTTEAGAERCWACGHRLHLPGECTSVIPDRALTKPCPCAGAASEAEWTVERLARALCAVHLPKHGGYGLPNCLDREGPWTATHLEDARDILAALGPSQERKGVTP
jgi:hypothetical protein